jgi:hypothetical protein
VLVSESERAKLAAYIEDRLRGRRDPPDLTICRGRNIMLTWDGAHLHIDDKLWPKRKEKDTEESHPTTSHPASVEITMEHHALEFLVPPAKP